MIRKVLIANRGEIAMRILRACRALGLQTVAVFSEVDRNALHVRLADEAYLLGPAPARESYLRAERIIEIARGCGADAIHPGYGFLAERADFAEACADAGLTFIGPRPSAIAAMGDKAIARATVTRAGVPVVPGTEDVGNLRDEDLLRLAPSIGFPLLIKATAGGGGKGMREVNSLEEMPALLSAARREAESSFGDGNVYLEKLVAGARHIEIQILADAHGNVLHLNERECSLQRRHQKLVEEAPSPLIGDDDDLRQRMGEVAVRAARAVGYVNAGTIEFLVDADRNFYFLEMNTRLQVEHPVTELITGVDIVKEQIRIADGLPLALRQEDVRVRGAAIECRVNAEDAYHGFLPSTGRVEWLQLPGGPGVRVDTGVYAGAEITPYYDPLIAKLITWGETRDEAIRRMQQALVEYHVLGVQTNLPFHQALLASEMFLAGRYDTRSIEREFSIREADQDDDPRAGIAAVMAVLAAHRQTARGAQIKPRNGRGGSAWKWAGRRERHRS